LQNFFQFFQLFFFGVAILRIFSNFAAMKRRILFSKLLLAIIVPVLLAGPLHHYAHVHQLQNQCESCVNHIPHHEHFNGGSALGECPLCNFFGIQYVASPSAAAPAHTDTLASVAEETPVSAPRLVQYHLSLRAPPACFC